MMLPATVKAATDLDVQVSNGLLQLKTLLGQPIAQLRRQPARGRNAQLARVRPRAGRNVNDSFRAGLADSRSLQSLMDFRQIALTHPAKDNVLFDRRADRFFGEA